MTATRVCFVLAAVAGLLAAVGVGLGPVNLGWVAVALIALGLAV